MNLFQEFRKLKNFLFNFNLNQIKFKNIVVKRGFPQGVLFMTFWHYKSQKRFARLRGDESMGEIIFETG